MSPSSSALDLLTPREREVCALVAEGVSPQKVAVRLKIAPKTVYAHLHNAADKIPGPGMPVRKIVRVFTILAASA